MISVLLPFRDAASTLAAAADSVLAQREVELELIAIDDGSRDGGAVRADPRVRRVRTEGIGIARALAAGLAVARGAWIARMDADDVSHPDRLRAQLALIASDERLGAVGTQVRAVDAGPGLTRYVAWQNALVSAGDHARERFVESTLCHPSVLLRRRALDEVGGWRAFDGPEDYDLWLRLDAAGWRLAKVPEILLDWCHVPGRATFADPRYAPPRLLAAKAPFIARVLASRGEFAIWGAGPTGKRLARALEPFGVRPAAFFDVDPAKLGRTARGAPIVAPARGRTIVVAVGAAGARAEIRAYVHARGGSDDELVLCA